MGRGSFALARLGQHISICLFEEERTLWRGPGAIVEEGEVKVVIYTAIRGEHSHLWSGLIIGFRCARSQCQNVAPLQAIRQPRSRTCDDAVGGGGGYCQRLDAAILSYVEDECLA